MTAIDYTFEGTAQDISNVQSPSVEIENTSWGYRIHEMQVGGSRMLLARAFIAAICFGLMAAGGMVWTLADATFPGDASITKAILSTSIYIIAGAFVINGAFSQRHDRIEVNIKGRALHIMMPSSFGLRKARKTLRFEEITRIDLADTNLMTELRSAVSRLDYSRITLTSAGKRIHIVGGDIADLEPLLTRLRGDTGVV